MIDPATHTFQSDDGLTLAYHEVGSGRPVVLLHGYISAALDTWLHSGAASGLMADGRRLIMLVIAGDDDNERGSVEDLAALLPHGRLRRVPGDHLTALLGPHFGDALAAFLAGH